MTKLNEGERRKRGYDGIELEVLETEHVSGG